jgi:cytochrome c biogenesis protein CcdA/thiol-disulfide isomerase/thioredoxin
MTLLLISFVAGLLTVLAPCTLPLLPVIIGGSVAEGRASLRALTIILSLGASVFLFTLILKVSTAFINVPQEVWESISGLLLLAFGLVTLFPTLWEKFGLANMLNRSSNRALAQGYVRKNFWGDAMIGAALGPVFSSCSPTYFIILATVLPSNLAEGLLYLLVYIFGLCLALMVIALIGQRIVSALGIASDPHGWFKRIIGLLFVLIGLAVIFGIDKQVETYLLSVNSPFDVTQVEQKLLAARSGTTNAMPPPQTPGHFLTLAQKASMYQMAPELAGIDGYLNTDGQPIDLAQYRGKDVVLIDFWTYSCINCLRTIPYLEAWYQKYEGEGLVVIGVHTPEFSFEHLTSNVQAAITRLGITYPVVQDNEYKTWDAFGSEYWPNEYLIDIDGYIVDNHSGEGDYSTTEAAIQQALAERAERLGLATSTIATSTVSIPEQDLNAIQSPETYFGSNRNEFLANGTPGAGGTSTFTLPSNSEVQPNALYLGGSWDIEPEYAQNTADAQVEFEYDSHDVYLVASASSPVTVEVLRDGEPVGSFAGSDVDPKTSTVTIQAQRLYTLIHDPTPGIHTIQLIVHGAGLQAYTFTFG